jgi:hypothetical protein
MYELPFLENTSQVLDYQSCTIAACSSATTEIESGAKLECFAIMLTELSAKVNVKPNR